MSDSSRSRCGSSPLPPAQRPDVDGPVRLSARAGDGSAGSPGSRLLSITSSQRAERCTLGQHILASQSHSGTVYAEPHRTRGQCGQPARGAQDGGLERVWDRSSAGSLRCCCSLGIMGDVPTVTEAGCGAAATLPLRGFRSGRGDPS